MLAMRFSLKRALFFLIAAGVSVCVREVPAQAPVAAGEPAAVARAGAGSSPATNAAPVLAPIRALTAEALREMLGGTNDFVLVDVMPALFFRDYHITGAMSVPEPELVTTVRDWPRGRRIVVYCLDRECESSRTAARTLMKMGFTDVLQYEGGKREWHAKQYEGTGRAKLLD